MYNCLILGSGRSGTSMIGGTLAHGGYFFGDKLIPPRAANPKGFFESGVVNNVNERILKNVMPRLQYGHRWLGLLGLPGAKNLYVSGKLIKEIKILISKQPFCYKDPRFCYTLPIWRPHLKNTKFVCVFRHPKNTVASTHQVIKRFARFLYQPVNTPFAILNDRISLAYSLTVLYSHYTTQAEHTSCLKARHHLPMTRTNHNFVAQE